MTDSNFAQVEVPLFATMRARTVPIKRLLAAARGQDMGLLVVFRTAEIIWGLDLGRDYGRDSWTVFSGRGRLEQIAEGTEARDVMVFAVAYDQRTRDLEDLVDLCHWHRGGCDYGGGVGRDEQSWPPVTDLIRLNSPQSVLKQKVGQFMQSISKRCPVRRDRESTERR